MRALFDKLFSALNQKMSLDIDRLPAGGITALPTQLLPFMWFFIRQIKGMLAVMLSLELVIAVSSSLVFWYVGELVKQGEFTAALLWGGFGLLIMRQFMIDLCHGIYDFKFIPYVGNMIRRQLYWYTARQSLAFFQNDFAGRIANKLIQSAPSLRDVIKSTLGSVWYALIFSISNLWFMAQASIWLALPLACWLLLYILTLCFFVPKVQKRSAAHAHVMSNLTGQIVDGFTNFLPTKYFARMEFEDRRVVGLLQDHSRTFRATTGTLWLMNFVIGMLNTCLLAATCLVGFWLIETQGHAGTAALAMALPMALQATFQSGWIMFEVAGIFENIGRVQEGLEALSKPLTVIDKPAAQPLQIPQGAATIQFDDVTFNYGADDRPVLENFNLRIPAGQKVGLVGRSGAGKSTIASLLVRAYDINDGRILIADQDIASVQQESLRRQITVVTQESYLFHRSVLDNIRYGNADASLDAVVAAAKKAAAHEFIMRLADSKGRHGYDSHVGERGVKLSGGQKQRVGIARAVLKNAPILILDEATSALDSESEHAIQQALTDIMVGKTVIAIAHRLSTLRQMDRILVLEAGKIIEDGTHDQLINRKNGHYARLWQMQSGGFLPDDD